MTTTIPLLSSKKIIIAGAFSFMIFPIFLYGQQKQKNTDCVPQNLPAGLKLRENLPVRYKIITDYYNQDIFGNFFNKSRVSGNYTRGLVGGKAQWNGVRIADADKKDDSFPEGTQQDYMEGLQYDPQAVMTDTLILKRLPTSNIYARTLIWDMSTFESFAWSHFDSLRLNIPYHARIYDKNISLGSTGNFINQDVKLVWTGISRMNAVPCAVIQFEAMENRINIRAENMTAKGRSHYWGNIWVSLEDKQLEQAWLNEDVIMEVDFSGADKQLINTVRKITVEKIKD